MVDSIDSAFEKRLTLALEQRLGTFELAASLDLPAKGVTGVFGPSGSGKTSLLRLIAGLERPSAGTITLGERILLDTRQRLFTPAHRRRIGVVFQEARLFPHYRVRANLTYGMPRPAPKRFDEVVELLGIEALLERMPGTLSGGEARRVAIGRALLSEPQLLLMDEPLTGLDGARKEELLRYIARLTRRIDIPVVYVSHEPDEIAAIADHLVVMRAGRVVASDNLATLLQRFDLTEALQGFNAASIIEATVLDHDADYGLTRVALDATHRLSIPTAPVEPGCRVRLRIQARDILLARASQPATSEENALAAVIDEMTTLLETPHQVELRLRIGPCSLRARLTRKACEAMNLQENDTVIALIRHVSLYPA